MAVFGVFFFLRSPFLVFDIFYCNVDIVFFVLDICARRAISTFYCCKKNHWMSFLVTSANWNLAKPLSIQACHDLRSFQHIAWVTSVCYVSTVAEVITIMWAVNKSGRTGANIWSTKMKIFIWIQNGTYESHHVTYEKNVANVLLRMRSVQKKSTFLGITLPSLNASNPGKQTWQPDFYLAM